jgi:hypothetical protein
MFAPLLALITGSLPLILLCVVLLQEEERERRMDFVPEESAVNTETIEVRAAAIAAHCCYT